MIIDQTISKFIDKRMVVENEVREREHKSSGKLSASSLGDPLQWQILHSLGVPKAPFDGYTLRKFKRGRDVEDWMVKNTPGIVDTQKFVEYRNTVGYLDILVDHTNYDFKGGLIPHEVKSVTNEKFKWIRNSGKPDDPHILQATLYAMALDLEYLAIDYVASDDLRILSYILKTDENRERVDNIIDAYDKQREKAKVPVFTPMYSWQKNKKYSKYPEWQDLTEEEIGEKINRLSISFMDTK